MDTILILRDTITAKVVKVVDYCPPSIQETETNWQDVLIVGIYCLVVTICVSIVAFAFYKWQKTKYCYQYKTNEQTFQYELRKLNENSTDNTNKPNEEPVDKFLAFCEDRKDIRENETFIDYCVAKYKTLKDKQLNS